MIAFGEKPDPTLPIATASELMEIEILIRTGQRLVNFAAREDPNNTVFLFIY
jgi:hypothetical protein